MPFILAADAVLVIVESVTNIPRPFSVFLAFFLTFAFSAAAVRALYGEPAAAASAVAIGSDPNATSAVYSVHIVLKFNLLSGVWTLLHSVGLFACSLGVCISTVSVWIAQQNPVLLGVVIIVGANL